MVNNTSSRKIAVLLKKCNKNKLPKNKWEEMNGMYICNTTGKSWINEDGSFEFLREIIWKTDSTNLIQFDEAAGYISVEAVRISNESGLQVQLTPGKTSG